MWFPNLAEPMLCQRKERAGLQHTEGFSEEPVAVGHVHCDVLRVSAIECFIIVRELLAVAVSKLHHVLHADKHAQSVGGLNEWSSYVDTFHVAAKAFGQVSGGTADATADVDEPVARLDR